MTFYCERIIVSSIFRRRPEDKLKRLQQIFHEKKDDSSPVDCETKDMDRFCRSLVNQFLDLLNFEREDIPDTVHKVGVSSDKGDRNTDTAETAFDRKEKNCRFSRKEQPEDILVVFSRSFQDFGIQELLDTDPIESVRSFRIEDIVYFIGRMKTEQAMGLEVVSDTEICGKITMFTEGLLEYIIT